MIPQSPGGRNCQLPGGRQAQDLITCRRAAGLDPDAKLGVDLLFDDNSYTEMFNALRLAPTVDERTDNRTADQDPLRAKSPRPSMQKKEDMRPTASTLPKQTAVDKVLSAVSCHRPCPPGTGKTTTLVQAIKPSSKGGRPSS